MPLYIGDQAPDAVRLGDAAVDKVMQGANQVWPPPPVVVTVTYATSGFDNANSTVYTHNVTDPVAAGHALVLGAYRRAGNDSTPPTVTIDGVPATILGVHYNLDSDNQTTAWAALGATDGATSQIVVTTAAAQLRSGVGVWKVSTASATFSVTAVDQAADAVLPGGFTRSVVAMTLAASNTITGLANIRFQMTGEVSWDGADELDTAAPLTVNAGPNPPGYGTLMTVEVSP